MSEVFPTVETVSMLAARPGSIVQVPHTNGSLLALVTDHVENNSSRSFVILNATFSRGRPVLFAANWQNEKHCLCYKNTIQFQLETARETVDTRGHEWWHQPGVIVAIGDQLYIRAAPAESFTGGLQLVNIQSGSLFTQEFPNEAWTFGVWRLWIRGPNPDQRLSLLEFDIRKQIQA